MSIVRVIYRCRDCLETFEGTTVSGAAIPIDQVMKIIQLGADDCGAPFRVRMHPCSHDGPQIILGFSDPVRIEVCDEENESSLQRTLKGKSMSLSQIHQN